MSLSKKYVMAPLAALVIMLSAAPAANAYQWSPYLFPSKQWCENYREAHSKYTFTHRCEKYGSSYRLVPNSSSSGGFGAGGGSDDF